MKGAERYYKGLKWNKFKLRKGTVLMLKPYVLMEDNKVSSKAVPGTIVYINRKHHFFVAEFKYPHGSFREAFKFYERDDFACLVPSVLTYMKTERSR